jgi:DNA-binding NarL/FixJ family response regulator
MDEVAVAVGPRVLIVEDEELVAFSLAKILRLRGFDPEVVGTVTAAIDALDAAATTRPFDHVLLDLKLPDADGENVLAHAEQMAVRPNVVVVAAPQNVDGHRILSLRGRCEYLPKPVIFETLLVMLEPPRAGTLGDYARTFALSDQERAVLERAVQGLDDDEIGAEIGCARTTVKSYWSRIYTKVGQKGRDQVFAHLTRWLLQGRERGSGAYRAVRVEPARPGLRKPPVSVR